MYTTISTANMTREEWLTLRKTGIGGSDAGAICGLNPYSSAMKVFLDKTGQSEEPEDNEAMRVGRDLEDYVARRFMEATGLKVRRSNQMYRSVEYPWMIADVDRLVVGEDAGLECKTVNAYGAEHWKDGAVPPHYLLQCNHYMAVTGKKVWYLAALILGMEFKFIRIERDEDMIRNLITIERNFWEKNVLIKMMPEPDGSSACDAVLEQYFKVSRKGTAIPLIGFDEKLRRREELSALLGKLETEKKQIEQEIKLYMGEHEQAFTEKYRISWSGVESSRLDTARIKAEQPEIYRDYLKITPSRRFTIKVA